MVEENYKIKDNKTKHERNTSNDSFESYMGGFLALRNAIIDNCRNCIRDCGEDCLDNAAKPIEYLRCPLQKVRVDFGIAINYSDHLFSGWKQPSKDNIML